MWEKVIIGSASSVVTGIVAYLLGMRRSRAETKKTEIEALKGALDIWQKTVEELRCEVNQLRQNNQELENRISLLSEDNQKLRNEITRLRYLNNRIIKLFELITPHNIEDIRNELKNLKTE